MRVLRSRQSVLGTFAGTGVSAPDLRSALTLICAASGPPLETSLQIQVLTRFTRESMVARSSGVKFPVAEPMSLVATARAVPG